MSYSSAKPKPPCVWMATLAASFEASAASIFAMLASAPHGSPESYRVIAFQRMRSAASSASISQGEANTQRYEEATGHLYEIQGGGEKKFEPAATDDGTSVAVRNLFYNVPARRQFLKTDATEFRHILRTIHNAALAHTEIGFEVIADTDDIYRLPPSDLKQRVIEIFGKQYRTSLIEFEEDTSYVKISGLLGTAVNGVLDEAVGNQLIDLLVDIAS
jgi:hypothetical protein